MASPAASICDICGKCFSKAANLKRHMLSHCSDGLFQCDVCDKSFSRPDVRNKHVQNIHGVVREEVAKAYPCVHGSCYQTFSLRKNMLRHYRDLPEGSVDEVQSNFEDLAVDDEQHDLSSARKAKMQCAHCSSTFSKQSNLNRHVRDKHADFDSSNNSGFPIDCPTCDRKFAKLSLS